MANVALDLPHGYPLGAKPSLVFLPVRGDPLTNGIHPHRERTADSLEQVAAGPSIATKRNLDPALDAGTSPTPRPPPPSPATRPTDV